VLSLKRSTPLIRWPPRDRPRSYLINEAITNYIELHAYQDALVRKGLEEMRKGRVVSHEEVAKRLKRTGRARQ